MINMSCPCVHFCEHNTIINPIQQKLQPDPTFCKWRTTNSTYGDWYTKMYEPPCPNNCNAYECNYTS